MQSRIQSYPQLAPDPSYSIEVARLKPMTLAVIVRIVVVASRSYQGSRIRARNVIDRPLKANADRERTFPAAGSARP